MSDVEEQQLQDWIEAVDESDTDAALTALRAVRCICERHWKRAVIR